MKFLTNFLWKLGWQLHKMCPNSPLVPKKRQVLDVSRLLLLCLEKKLTCSEHPGLWRIFGITHIISKCAFISSRHKVKKVDKEPEKKTNFVLKITSWLARFFLQLHLLMYYFLTVKVVSNQKKIKLHKRFCYFSFGACEEMCIKPTFHWCNDTFLLWKIGFDDENCSGQAKPPMHCSSLAIQSYWEELGCFIHLK